MALFEREDQDYGADGTTRALSVTAVETDFVWRVYEKLATVYDLTFGPALHPGRIVAKERMKIRPGDRVLEVGIGTGINVSLYPRTCHVTGIDLSAKMLEKAHERVAKEGLTNVELLEMDATKLAFEDNSFDVVYAPYVISVVPDPVKVVREMSRVCRPGGKIIILNHFRSTNPVLATLERDDLAAHRAHRVHRRSRSARRARAGRSSSRSRSRRSASRRSGRSSPARRTERPRRARPGAWTKRHVSRLRPSDLAKRGRLTLRQSAAEPFTGSHYRNRPISPAV